jgi:hypothetical protein
MTLPDDKHSRNSADRFRKILSAEKDEQPVPESRKPPVVNLPKARAYAADSGAESIGNAGVQAGARLPDRRVLPIFWTVASIVSLVANAFLFIQLTTAWRGVGAASAAGFGPGLLAGLYGNFAQMDQAHIQATIPVRTSVQLNTTIPVQTTTSITLAQDVTIQDAHVKINTGGLNIDAPASITLPAGTLLEASLDFRVPVQADLPIALDIPVDIAVQDTGLHSGLSGMQDTIRSAVCAASPGALTSSGQTICR